MQESSKIFCLCHDKEKTKPSVFFRDDFNIVFLYTFFPTAIYLTFSYLILPLIFEQDHLNSMMTFIESKIFITELNSIISSFFILVFYIITIYITYRLIVFFYKKNEKTHFNGTEISAVFNISILLNIPNALALFLSSYIKTSDNDIFRNYYLSIIISSILLYLGFIFPLEDILSDRPMQKFHCYFFKPFKDVGIKKISWPIIITLIILLAYTICLSCTDKIQTIILGIVFILLLLFVVVALIFEKIRNKRILKFIKYFKYSPNALIYILGEDTLWTKHLNDELKYNEVEKIDRRKKYDTIVIIDRRNKKSELELPDFTRISKTETKIFDPFISQKKHTKSYPAAWCGYPFLQKYKFTRNEYLKLLTKHPNQSFDINQNQNTL